MVPNLLTLLYSGTLLFRLARGQPHQPPYTKNLKRGVSFGRAQGDPDEWPLSTRWTGLCPYLPCPETYVSGADSRRLKPKLFAKTCRIFEFQAGSMPERDRSCRKVGWLGPVGTLFSSPSSSLSPFPWCACVQYPGTLPGVSLDDGFVAAPLPFSSSFSFFFLLVVFFSFSFFFLTLTLTLSLSLFPFLSCLDVP